MGLVKKCRHGRGKGLKARRAAWRSCSCQWYGDLRVNGVRVYAPLGPDEAEARVSFARLNSDRAAGKLSVAGPVKPSVRAVAEAWLESVKAENPPPRPATVIAYRSRVKVIASWYGDGPIEAVTPEDIEEFWAEVESAYSANYARDIRTTTKHVLEYAARRKLIGAVPLPTGRRRRKIANGNGGERLSIEDAEKVIEALDEPLRSMAEVGLLTGLRRGELLGLRVRDIDFERARLRLSEQVGQHGRGPLKTDTSNRVVPLSPRAVRVLADRTEGSDPADAVFEVSYWTAGFELRRAMKSAGVYAEGRGWHSFRHANAALRERAGESLRSAAASLGHGARYAQTLAYGWSAESADASPLDHARERR